jgi:MinD superfamily P-loop ATPase
MKEVVVISGKGGTGKTSLTASFSVLGGADLVVADCDVDAADMHLLLEPDMKRAEDFYSGELAVIDSDKCTACGRCKEICRFNAIEAGDESYKVDHLSCDGCGYCARICPAGAIGNRKQNVGQLYVSNIRTGAPMVHARLGIGADNSGKLVARVKNEAKKKAEELKKELVLVDGSPGIGCPVVSSLSGADYVVLVTEPTVSGVHDLKRVYQLVRRFGIKTGCIVNKADLNPAMRDNLRGFMKEEGIDLLAEIPYDENFTKAVTNGKTIVEWDESLKDIVSGSWDRINTIVNAL